MLKNITKTARLAKITLVKREYNFCSNKNNITGWIANTQIR